MTTHGKNYDYIIVGGGLAGSVVAHRLHESDRSLSILVLEAGLDVGNDPNVRSPLGLLVGTEVDYNANSIPQSHLDGKPRYQGIAKALGGGTVINGSAWIRGPKEDYDAWARHVSDPKWSYEGLLPYFKKTEHHFDPTHGDPAQHGFDGPIYTTTALNSGRHYPLREPVLEAWKALGVERIVDGNGGSPRGVTEVQQNLKNDQREIASNEYSLSGVEVKTVATVRRIVVERVNGKLTATGIELVNADTFTASREVILSAGAYKTPQVLLLSGIGDSNELKALGISPVVHSPHVGKNLHDHPAMKRFWRLRNPENGLAVGAFKWHNNPAYTNGIPMDWLAAMTVPSEGLVNALTKDGIQADEKHPLVEGGRDHLEIATVYVPLAGARPDLDLPIDGSVISTLSVEMLPTSRGTVTLNSTDPTVNPIIDPNYLASDVDRYVLRESMRITSKLFESAPGKEFVEKEIVPDGFQPIPSTGTDEEMDRYIKQGLTSSYHPAGTASMGSVVDADLKVVGMDKLRVVDASVIPVPLAGHYQVPVYALAEQAVDLILRG